MKWRSGDQAAGNVIPLRNAIWAGENYGGWANRAVIDHFEHYARTSLPATNIKLCYG